MRVVGLIRQFRTASAAPRQHPQLLEDARYCTIHYPPNVADFDRDWFAGP
jgi:hypothetical protein